MPAKPIQLKRTFVALSALACALAAMGGVQAHAEDVDMIVFGGTIYTLQGSEATTVEALAIHGGQVIAAGSETEIRSLAGAGVRELDLAGNFAVPGLVDAHAHLFNLGKLKTRAMLVGTSSAQECLEILKAHEATLAPDEWLFGRGWDQNDWENPVYPDRQMLDALFPDRPVLLDRVGGHATWVNGAALEIAGIDRDTLDPEGGEIVRDPKTGEATGILIDAAEMLIWDQVSEPTPQALDRQVDAAMEAMAAAGLTGMHEMGIDLRQLEALRRAEREGRLRARVVVYLGGDEVLADYEGGPDPIDPSALLRVEGVKLYIDGGLGSRGAALLADYSDRPGHQGLPRTSMEVLRAHVTEAYLRGFPVAIHAIGDRGNRVSLDAIEGAYEIARGQNQELPSLQELRPRIEHAQVVHPDDIPRFCELGIIPSMQPTHCTSDMPWAPDRLGEDRLAGAYAWQGFLESGCLLPLGSDFPVESVSPLLGIYAARTRQTTEASPPGGWSPEQRLSALEALLGFTSWTADVLGIQSWGRLAPGCRADITVLDVDPLKADAAALLDANVVMTVLEGEIQYGELAP